MIIISLLTRIVAAAAVECTKRLHLGGERDIDVEGREWVVVSLDETLPVGLEVVRSSVADLSSFPDASVCSVYSSHVLEHLPYSRHRFREEGNALSALREWRRVLWEGGELFVSVPDLPTLARFYLREDFDLNLRFQVMQMMYGGQTDSLDFHQAGYDEEFLVSLLRASGTWCDIERVWGGFGLFDDASGLAYDGIYLSLNIRAVACNRDVQEAQLDDAGVSFVKQYYSGGGK